MQSILEKADVRVVDTYIDHEQQLSLYNRLKTQCSWVFMKYINNPRIPETETNTYYHAATIPGKLTLELQRYLRNISEEYEIYLDNIKLNYYPTSDIGLFYHRDDDCIGDSTMFTLSLGASRRIWFRDIETKEEISTVLKPGSLTIMGNDSQFKYEHSIKPDNDFTGGRIAICFRDSRQCTL